MTFVRLVAMAALLVTACSKGDEGKKSEPARSPTPSSGAGHAANDVVPGSHEDWCGEHAVPESQCTRCNPELVAAFKATGDWCAEHGLPESQCTICNPDLKIVRPPPGGTSPAPAPAKE